ncbi:hypothetical protein HYX14_02980 [Candidatus Woesearchaeota archaeon]|nr:hypothetical protein [Candidatus Woesearchaeota archaeon]
MKNTLELILGTMKANTSRVLVAASMLLYPGCEAALTTDQEKCCDCLTENRCTSSSEYECAEIFETGSKGISANTECVKKNGCYEPCAAAGAYFK